ncbi:MAG: 16S rRNA methyltransferase [Candidatus Helarchaeota archaeon]
MLTIILVESALETLPQELTKYASIKKLAKKKNKKPKDLLLDTSLHHNLMKELPEREKRGRPDIVHFSLLLAVNSPLYKSGLLNVFIHTRQDKVIKLNPKIRIPKNYNRFVGLIEQLFKKHQVPPQKEALMTIQDLTLKDLISELNPDEVILFHEDGENVVLNNFFKHRTAEQHLIILIGGFPHGSFSKNTEICADVKISIDPEPLETITIISEAIYSYGHAINLKQRRYEKFDKKVTDL